MWSGGVVPGVRGGVGPVAGVGQAADARWFRGLVNARSGGEVKVGFGAFGGWRANQLERKNTTRPGAQTRTPNTARTTSRTGGTTTTHERTREKPKHQQGTEVEEDTNNDFGGEHFCFLLSRPSAVPPAEIVHSGLREERPKDRMN